MFNIWYVAAAVEVFVPAVVVVAAAAAAVEVVVAAAVVVKVVVVVAARLCAVQLQFEVFHHDEAFVSFPGGPNFFETLKKSASLPAESIRKKMPRFFFMSF